MKRFNPPVDLVDVVLLGETDCNDCKGNDDDDDDDADSSFNCFTIVEDF